jgi:hypothetical protein
MHAEMDGASSPEESDELRRYLDSDPEARRHYDELREVGRIMASAERVSPPAGLRESVMETVAELARRAQAQARTDAHRSGSGMRVALPRGRRPRIGLASRVREWMAPAPRLRYACAFAAGLVVGIALFTVLVLTVPPMVPGERSLLYGALGMGAGCAATSEPVSFEAQDASGRASVLYCAASVLVELDLSSRSDLLVEIVFDERVDFDGFRALQSGDHSVTVAGNSVELTHSGDRSYELMLTDDTESRLPVRMRVVSGDRLLLEETLPPMRKQHAR